MRARHVERHPLCHECEKLGMTEPVKDVDHIIEIKDGGDPWDENNLMSLCRYHHIIKTNAVRKSRKEKEQGIVRMSDFK